MQTFLPYSDFRMSAECLDRQRLGKQRVEVMQILRTLAGKSEGWRNHPAVLMWRGHERALVRYGLVVCDEWVRRGYKDNCREQIATYDSFFRKDSVALPPWFGQEDFHRSHQSNLKRKDPEHYDFDVDSNLPYLWPGN